MRWVRRKKAPPSPPPALPPAPQSAALERATSQLEDLVRHGTERLQRLRERMKELDPASEDA